MYISTEQSESMSELAAKLSVLTEFICAPVIPAVTSFVVNASNDIFADIAPSRVLRIITGQVDYCLHGKCVAHFGAGDLIGLPRSLNLPQGQFSCDTSVELVAYERDDLVEHAHQDLKSQRNWTHYLVCYISYLERALAQEPGIEFQPAAGFVHFRAGETIIQQGTVADRVYTLLDGSADAVCDGVTVGHIHINEIFGALAVFTRQPRMASVIATSDCTLLAVRKEEFIALVEHQPQICIGLIEEMAAKINQLNNQLLSHTRHN